MTFIDWLVLLPLWGKVLVGLLGVEVFVMLGLISFRSVVMARRLAEALELMRQLIQEAQTLSETESQCARTLSLMLGMQISERDRRQAKEEKKTADKDSEKLSA